MKSSDIGSYVDNSILPPAPFRGEGRVKLIVLGQDLTVRDAKSRENIKVTLLLNQPGRLKDYIKEICDGLNSDLEQSIYATNLLKNFFTTPPDKFKKEKPEFFNKAASFWIPLIKKEIEEFENVPLLTLGELILNALTKRPEEVLIRSCISFQLLSGTIVIFFELPDLLVYILTDSQI